MSEAQNFEKKLQQINQIVEQMERQETGLEQSLKLYEQGIKLTRECQQIIDQAEQKITKLMEQEK